MCWKSRSQAKNPPLTAHAPFLNIFPYAHLRHANYVSTISAFAAPCRRLYLLAALLPAFALEFPCIIYIISCRLKGLLLYHLQALLRAGSIHGEPCWRFRSRIDHVFSSASERSQGAGRGEIRLCKVSHYPISHQLTKASSLSLTQPFIHQLQDRPEFIDRSHNSRWAP